MTVNIEALKKSITILADDLDSVGWGLNNRIYHIVDDPEDPTIRLAGELHCPPEVELTHMFDAGVRCPDNLLGLVVACEIVRHLTFEELVERHPDMVEKIAESWKRDKGTDLPPEMIMFHAKNYYYDTMLPGLPSPDEMPEHMQTDLRVLNVVLRDGTVIADMHARDQVEHSTSIAPPEIIDQTAIPGGMYLFLHGLRPDVSSIKDVKQAVEDYLTVQSIEKGI